MPFNIPYSPAPDSSEMFKTHWNYIKCLNNLLTDLSITVNISTINPLDPSTFTKFEKLSQITQASIQAEVDACEEEVAYTTVIAPWIPVKSYYRLYYLESTFLYLLCGDGSGFRNGGHTRVRNSLRGRVESGEISFDNISSQELSDISVWEAATNFTTHSGRNISTNYHLDPNCPKSVRKKIAEYIRIDWMQKNRIDNFRTKKAQYLRDTDLKLKQFLLTDYFYWMRIKANYRDVDFLDFDNDVNVIDSYEYIKEFTESSEKYATALQDAISQMKVNRGI